MPMETVIQAETGIVVDGNNQKTRGVGMYRANNPKGFSLLGILITVVIIAILSMGGLRMYSGVAGVGTDYKPDTVKGGVKLGALRKNLKTLAMFQNQEYELRRTYIPTIDNLIERTFGAGYNALATDRVPLIPMFDVKMTITSSGFEIRAVPDLMAGAPKDSPTYVVDQTMNLREE